MLLHLRWWLHHYSWWHKRRHRLHHQRGPVWVSWIIIWHHVSRSLLNCLLRWHLGLGLLFVHVFTHSVQKFTTFERKFMGVFEKHWSKLDLSLSLAGSRFHIRMILNEKNLYIKKKYQSEKIIEQGKYKRNLEKKSKTTETIK